MEWLYAIGTVIGIAGTMMLRDFRDGKNLFSKNTPPEKLDQGFQYMKNHYNDEITSHMERQNALSIELQIDLKKIGSSMEDVKDGMNTIIRDGVRIRN